MGGGVSTLDRGRKNLVIRAYNKRPKTQTVSEQFAVISKTNKFGQLVIYGQDIKRLIGLGNCAWFDDLIASMDGAGSVYGEIPFDGFITFLETGRMPEQQIPPPTRAVTSVSSSNRTSNRPKAASVKATRWPSPTRKKPPEQISRQENPLNAERKDNMSSKLYEPEAKGTRFTPAVRGHQPRAVPRRFVEVNYARPGDRWYPDVYACLGFRTPTSCRELQPHAGATLSLNRKDAHRRAQPQRALFRKRETEIHERIVQYTTIDAEGTVQELIETQRSHNEVVHLECKETAEFVHRERLNMEQWETFNNEVVSEERGHEEYLHLKSKHDEYEHLDSNMPKKPEEEQANMETEAPAEPLPFTDEMGTNQDHVAEMGTNQDHIDKTFATDDAVDGGEAPPIGLDISNGIISEQWQEEQYPVNYSVTEPAPTPIGTNSSPVKVSMGDWQNYMDENEDLTRWKLAPDSSPENLEPLARSSFLVDPHPPPSPTSAGDRKAPVPSSGWAECAGEPREAQ